MSISIIGLGNPRKSYKNTKHNLGQDWVYKISKLTKKTPIKKINLKAETFSTHDSAIHWFAPSTYVNNSGQSVSRIIKYKKFKLENMIIIHDDLDLPLGQLRFRLGGSHGGHNGIKHIIETCGESFYRLRVGIGRPVNNENVTSWVLGKILPKEKDILATSFNKFASLIEILLISRIEDFQKKINTN